ncbi:MAG TPA: bifunctional glutamate N-acetyltransferase/amino-acid acetyltransferase ArgJ [Euryarchaeota archaeon]|nr:bifunctional glutamate N-acetyltransferase/amino-acid acetyltransferase ArgJ [Euryarchaeota archaeon]
MTDEISVPGFRVGGKRGKKYGLAIVASDVPANCSVMATSNKIRASPVELSLKHARDNVAQGVVISSGNANAFTGEQGERDARRMCELASESLGVDSEDVIVNSTGIIGQNLEMSEIEELIDGVAENLQSNDSGINDAADAMRTTDSFEKIASRNAVVNGENVRVTGFAKGAGMIAPDLLHATMIAVILTDAQVPKDKIDDALRAAVDLSFNMINVDGDTSTNDMVVLLANGTAGNGEAGSSFQTALNAVCLDLARLIVKDGEGATKLFEVEIHGAVSSEDARRAAKSVVRSTLVKTAIFGENPNWGRVVAAIGYSGAEFDKSRLSLRLSDEKEGVVLVEDGVGVALKGTVEIKKAGEILKSSEVRFTADLGVGDFTATAIGCDLGYNYVKVNAEYTT